MSTLVLLLEEPSARALLEGLLPRILSTKVEIIYLVFEGKQDLEKNVTRKLRGWRRPDTVFAILRDQDAGDCRTVKANLAKLVHDSGRDALVRIACRELEAWVAGDLRAVATAFDSPGLVREANKQKFRDPDSLGSPVEELRHLVAGYQKIDGARRVGSLLDPGNNSSASFRVFCSGIVSLVERGAT